MVRRVTYNEYLIRVALTLAWRHRPVWSGEEQRLICGCGRTLPCRIRHRLPIGRSYWPEESYQQLSEVLTAHTRDTDGFCTQCRAELRIVRFPCYPVKIAVRTFAGSVADRVLAGLA